MPDKVGKIIEFMKVLDKVCLVKRATLLSDGTSETDSSHTFKLSFMIMMVYPYLKHKYDYQRLLELALVHDIAEAETGDFPKSVQVAHPETKKIKAQKELEAMQKYKNMLPEKSGDKIFELWQEYEVRQTPEAKLVAALDKIDANLQANLYHDGDVRYWEKCEDGKQYYKICTEKKQAVAILDEPVVEELENAIINLAWGNMKKWNVVG